MVVVHEDGRTFEEESDLLSSDRIRGYEGYRRHVRSPRRTRCRRGVSGELVWTVDTCLFFDATLSFTPDGFEAAGECFEQQ